MSGEPFFELTKLDGGLRVITESILKARSVALGFWVDAGTRDEPSDKGGISHFLEHLMFKGTNKRTAVEIAQVFDGIGGELNAFSAKEYTCYYSRVLDHHVPIAVDVLSDMLDDSLFNKADIDQERKVVLEEINMHHDAPSDLIFDLADRQLLKDISLSKPVLGTATSIKNCRRADVIGFMESHYRSSGMVIAAAGHLRHKDIVDLVKKSFKGRRGRTPKRKSEKIAPKAHTAVYQRQTQQAHICYGFEGIPVDNPERFALAVLDTVLGGGMSSRLFQNIREKRGLVYSVYSYNSQFSDTGVFGVYAGTTPARGRLVIDLIRQEIEKMLAGGPTAEEFDRAKEHLKGSMILGLEDTTTRMTRLGRGTIYGSEILSPDEIERRIEAVTMDDVRDIAQRILTRPQVITVIGPYEKKDLAGLPDVRVLKDKRFSQEGEASWRSK